MYPQTCPDGRRLFADVLAQVYSRPSVGLVLGQRRTKLTGIVPGCFDMEWPNNVWRNALFHSLFSYVQVEKMPQLTVRDIFIDCQDGLRSHGKLVKSLSTIYNAVSTIFGLSQFWVFFLMLLSHIWEYCRSCNFREVLIFARRTN